MEKDFLSLTKFVKAKDECMLAVKIQFLIGKKDYQKEMIMLLNKFPACKLIQTIIFRSNINYDLIVCVTV